VSVIRSFPERESLSITSDQRGNKGNQSKEHQEVGTKPDLIWGTLRACTKGKERSGKLIHISIELLSRLLKADVWDVNEIRLRKKVRWGMARLHHPAKGPGGGRAKKGQGGGTWRRVVRIAGPLGFFWILGADLGEEPFEIRSGTRGLRATREGFWREIREGENGRNGRRSRDFCLPGGDGPWTTTNLDRNPLGGKPWGSQGGRN